MTFTSTLFLIFERAFDLHADAQAKFVAHACDENAALRDKVLSLLSLDQLDLDFDAVLVEDAVANTDDLWPELPKMIPNMQHLFDQQARPLTDNLDQHRLALEQLREQSKPIDDIDGKTRHWRFSTDALQWQHDTLAELVTRLGHFVHSDQGSMNLVAARQKTAALVGFHTIASPQAN